MAYFDWNEKLATGIPSIDEQHKKLISFVNELHETMRQGKGKDAAGHILQELIKYTDYHFSNEERAFDAYGYPRAQEHKKQHSDLIKQLGEQLVKFQKGELGISISMLDFLVNWVTGHIMQQDMLYVPFFKDKNVDI